MTNKREEQNDAKMYLSLFINTQIFMAITGQDTNEHLNNLLSLETLIIGVLTAIVALAGHRVGMYNSEKDYKLSIEKLELEKEKQTFEMHKKNLAMVREDADFYRERVRVLEEKLITLQKNQAKQRQEIKEVKEETKTLEKKTENIPVTYTSPIEDD